MTVDHKFSVRGTKERHSDAHACVIHTRNSFTNESIILNFRTSATGAELAARMTQCEARLLLSELTRAISDHAAWERGEEATK